MAGTTEHVFPVRRRLLSLLGWFMVSLGAFTLLVVGLWTQALSRGDFLASLVAVLFGVFCIRSVRNVREIKVDDQRIRFLPVAADLHFSEIERIEVPGWADRHDTPPNTIGSIALDTNTTRTRLVPGAIAQWNNGCRIYTYGCDADRLLSLLRQYIPDK